ncbi:mechanosensitive ion channel [bacterium]|nr:mechanosensitive ion channel [bacterium]
MNAPLDLIIGTIQSMIDGFFARSPYFLMAIGVLLIAFVASRMLRTIIQRGLRAAKVRDALIRLIVNLIGIATWIAAVAIALTIVIPSVTPANLIAGLGLTSVAIGFAFKDIFENFLAGVIILARDKMRIGDVIECEEVEGRIENILIRETHVRETDGELVIVPNAYLFKNPLKIQTDDVLKRVELVVGVDYATDLERARDALVEAIGNCSSVAKDHETEVKCVAFGASSIDFQLLWWADSQPKGQRASFDEVAFAVKRALDMAGVSIPFPQTVLSFRPEAQPVQLESRTSAAPNIARLRGSAEKKG